MYNNGVALPKRNLGVDSLERRGPLVTHLGKKGRSKLDPLSSPFQMRCGNVSCKSHSSTRRYVITGSQRASNFWWASIISLGGLAFLLTGFAAFVNTNVLIFNQSQNIAFFPQGLIMCFYGSLGCIFGLYLWCTILWGVGNGFNEFDKKQGVIRIFRWGLPGKDRRIDLVYQLDQVAGVRVELKEGVNQRRTISLRLKSNRMSNIIMGSNEPVSSTKQAAAQNYQNDTSKRSLIPLTRIGQPIGLEDIESEASELAQFLQVPLDSFYEV